MWQLDFILGSDDDDHDHRLKKSDPFIDGFVPTEYTEYLAMKPKELLAKQVNDNIHDLFPMGIFTIILYPMIINIQYFLRYTFKAGVQGVGSLNSFFEKKTDFFLDGASNQASPDPSCRLH